METKDAVQAFQALAQETRLDVFRLLVTAGPDGLPAGQIAQELAVPANTLSFHLSALKQAGMVTCRRDGRSLIYTANFRAMRDLTAFLTENCCVRSRGVDDGHLQESG